MSAKPAPTPPPARPRVVPVEDVTHHQDMRRHNHVTQELRPDSCLRCKHLTHDPDASPLGKD